MFFFTVFKFVYSQIFSSFIAVQAVVICQTACSPPFLLKSVQFLISSSAIANHDVIIQGSRRDEKSLIFSSRAYALVSRGKRLRHSHAEVLRAVTLQRKIRDCSQSIICWHVVRCYTSFIIFWMFLGHHLLPISTKEVLIT